MNLIWNSASISSQKLKIYMLILLEKENAHLEFKGNNILKREKLKKVQKVLTKKITG